VKIVKRLLLLAILLVVLLCVGVVFFGGSMVRVGVEKGAAFYLDVPVSVGSGSLNPLTGYVGLSDLQIGNPPGFKSKNAFTAGHVGVGAQIGSLLSDTIVINEMTMRAGETTVELGPGGTNLGVLMDRVNKKGGKTGGDEPGGAKRKYKIKEIKITETKVHVAQPLGGPTITSTLPDVVVRDIGYGGDGSGATMGQVIQIILAEIAKSASGIANLPDEIAKSLSREGIAAVDAILKGDTKNIGQELEKSATQAVKGIEDIFKKKDDKKK
jgi:hypothetical protein